jgi:predicted transcriptional regulator
MRIAAREGREAGEIVQELLSRSLGEEARFIAAVELGEDELDRGDFLTHEDVGLRVRRLREA